MDPLAFLCGQTSRKKRDEGEGRGQKRTLNHDALSFNGRRRNNPESFLFSEERKESSNSTEPVRLPSLPSPHPQLDNVW